VRLTDGERRVLVALCRPLAARRGAAIPASNREIAAELHLSTDGVKTHVRALFAKLGIEDLPQYRKRTELARRALDLGLVTPGEIHKP
jgi:ATP/maltotriose-dependent transcriptional regulator MalT